MLASTPPGAAQAVNFIYEDNGGRPSTRHFKQQPHHTLRFTPAEHWLAFMQQALYGFVVTLLLYNGAQSRWHAKIRQADGDGSHSRSANLELDTVMVKLLQVVLMRDVQSTER